jgi:phosphatidylglycerophosphatase A
VVEAPPEGDAEGLEGAPPAAGVGGVDAARRLSFGQRCAEIWATWFGCGLSPRAPGTVGSLGAWPLHLLLRGSEPWLHWGIILIVTVTGIYAAERVATARGEKDPSRVVIDEVAGALIALGLAAPHGLVAECVAMGLFRALDIGKPGIIRRAERVPPAGLGIMLDDLLAGVIAGWAVRVLPWPA